MTGNSKVIFTLGCSETWAPPQPGEVTRSRMQAILVLRGSTYRQTWTLLADAPKMSLVLLCLTVSKATYSSMEFWVGCCFLLAPQNYKCQALGQPDTMFVSYWYWKCFPFPHTPHLMCELSSFV